MTAHPGQDRRLPDVATHPRPQHQENVAPGSLSTGSSADRTPVLTRGESDETARAGVLWLPSANVTAVIVGTEKVPREAGEPV